MSELELYMMREDKNTRVALNYFPVGTAEASDDGCTLFVAPVGGCRLLRIHLSASEGVAASSANNWTFTFIVVKKATGAQQRTVQNASLDMGVYGLAQYKTITLPYVGRLDERLKPDEALAIVATEQGTGLAFGLNVQVEYLLSER